MTDIRPKVLITKIGVDGRDRGCRIVAVHRRDAGLEVVYMPPWQEIATVVKLAQGARLRPSSGSDSRSSSGHWHTIPLSRPRWPPGSPRSAAASARRSRALEVHRGPRTAVCRIDVARDDGGVVAAFTGTVYVTSRSHAKREPPAS